jgi:hypothetical protein
MVKRTLLVVAMTVLGVSVAAQQPGRSAKSARTPESASVDVAVQTTPPPPPPPPPAVASKPARPASAAKPAPPPPPPPPEKPKFKGQPINLKVEAIISDLRGSAEPIRKTLSVVVGDGQQGMVRSDSQFPGGVVVPLHIDASPDILGDGKIRLQFGLEYDLMRPGGDGPGPTPQKIEIREHVTLILENGKPVVATQSADPISDRQVTVEVKAMILK